MIYLLRMMIFTNAVSKYQRILALEECFDRDFSHQRVYECRFHCLAVRDPGFGRRHDHDVDFRYPIAG